MCALMKIENVENKTFEVDANASTICIISLQQFFEHFLTGSTLSADRKFQTRMNDICMRVRETKGKKHA